VNSTIYLMRHGSIEGHQVRRYVGQHDTPLDEDGRDQARCWGEHLAGKNFSAVYASDLSRCVETAKLASRRDDLLLIPKLREIALGEWENLTVAHIHEQYPELYKARGEDLAGIRPPGGESFEDLSRRVVPVFETIAHESRGEVLVVAHSGVNRVIICHILGIPVGNLFRFGQDYCCLNRIIAKDGELHLDWLNMSCW